MSESPQRIVITADVLRPQVDRAGVPATRMNGQWLHRLLAYPLQQVTALPVSVVGWGEGFDTDAFYRALDLPPSIDGWAAVHYSGELPTPAESIIEAAFSGSVVISCEIAPAVAAALGRLGIPLIDTIGHPIRFLDDLLNAWRSNRSAVTDRLRRYAFDLAQAQVQAGLIAAKMAWTAPPALPDDTVVLLGQVRGDKALIDRATGTLVSFADFIEPLFEMAERHACVLYRPHPYAKTDPSADAVIGRFKSFRRTERNFYHLLTEPKLTSVYAISSGGCAEAAYFGKAGHCFLGPLYDFAIDGPDAFGLEQAVPVEQAWLWPAFWRAVLEPLVPVRQAQWPEWPYRSNRIRRSLNADWGFGAIDAVVSAAMP